MERPFCPLCKTNHFAREDHDFGKDTNADIGKAPQGGKRTAGRSADSSSFRIPAQAGEMPAKNTSREGRRVLKAEAARPDATRTTATAKARPAPRPRKHGGDGTAAKPETAPKFDRTAYQRKYMREYRKRKKS